MKFLMIVATLFVGTAAFAAEVTLTDSLSIMNFLIENPALQQTPNAIQLSRGETVKVTSIKYNECDVMPLTSMVMEVSNSQGHVITNIRNGAIPCPKK